MEKCFRNVKYAIAGYSNVSGPYSGNFMLIKTNMDGNMSWIGIYGGPENDAAYSLVRTSDGGYALAGFAQSFGAKGNYAWLLKRAHLCIHIGRERRLNFNPPHTPKKAT